MFSFLSAVISGDFGLPAGPDALRRCNPFSLIPDSTLAPLKRRFYRASESKARRLAAPKHSDSSSVCP